MLSFLARWYPFAATDLPDGLKHAAFGSHSMPTIVNIPELHTVLTGTSPRGHIVSSEDRMGSVVNTCDDGIRS